MKKIQKLGRVLSKDEQKKILGGNIDPCDNAEAKRCTSTHCSTNADCIRPSGACVCLGTSCGYLTGTC